MKETSLDFSKIRTAAMSLFNNRGEILRHGNLSLAKNLIKKMFAIVSNIGIGICIFGIGFG